MNIDALVKVRGVAQQSRTILWIIIAIMGIFLVWSYFAVLNEVAIG